MKIIKYLLAAILVISVSKKVHVQDDASTIKTKFSKFFSLKFKDSQTPKPELKLKDYDPAQRIAHMIDASGNTQQTYVGVIEVDNDFADKLPDASIPALRFITTIPKKDFHEIDQSNPTVNLYGIEVTGEPLNVKSGNKTIGFYWSNNKIVQLTEGINRGKTYVGIIEPAQRNYKNNFAIGPVVTWFDTDAIKHELLRTYGIPASPDTNFDNLITKTAIGTVRIKPTVGKAQKAKLYGVLLDTTRAQPSHRKYSKDFINSQAPQHILKETIVPRMDQFTKQTLAQVQQRAAGMYQAVQPTSEIVEG